MEKTETTEMEKGGSGKEAQRGTQESRYKGDGTAKKITKRAKVKVFYWNVEGFRKKGGILGLRETI
jgi:hypothetical protein